ncbi:GAF domain-containing protein [bacterium]|nr:GAF domain-containing protein [bacterium]
MFRERKSSLAKELDTLYRISKFIDSITDLKQLLKLIMEESKNVVNAEASSLLLYDREKDELYFEVALGKKGEKVKEIRLKASEGVAGTVAKKKKSINIGDVTKTNMWDNSADKTSGFETHSLLAVPMLRKNNLVGVIEVLNKKGRKGFTNEDVRIMEILAEQAALCIENARLYEESLRAARMAAIGQTMAELSHYIKNVLAGFEGAGSLLESGLQKENREMIEQGWSFLKKSQEKISTLVMNMLSYSKEKKLSFNLYDINKVISDVVSLMQPRLKEKSITIEKNLDKNIKEIVIDSDGIYNCVLNLISNAMDAMESENGKITVNTLNDEKNKQVKIEIKDSGNGIPKDKINDVFNLFYSSKTKGTGLGLAVTKKIIDEHKGKILVESKEGKGTTFTIILPTKG